LTIVNVHSGAGVVLHPQGVEVSIERTGATAGNSSAAHEIGGVGEGGHGYDGHGRSAESEEWGEGHHVAQRSEDPWLIGDREKSERLLFSLPGETAAPHGRIRFW
jgi:hypothetical protein